FSRLRTHQGCQRLLQVAERGGKTPGAEMREPVPQAGETEFRLYAALGAEELMPFVHHDALEGGHLFACARIGQQQGQAFGSGDKYGWETLALTGVDGGG